MVNDFSQHTLILRLLQFSQPLLGLPVYTMLDYLHEEPKDGAFWGKSISISV
jgi:hypothetical protein